MSDIIFDQTESSPMNPFVDEYLAKGCGRCPYHDTPKCRVHDWRAEMEQLRALVLASGLIEEIKWSVPCYTWKKNNVVMVSAFREYAALSFFKGSLMNDSHGLLMAHGENSQSSRSMRFTAVDQVTAHAEVIRAYLQEAIAIEQSGQKVQFKKVSEQKVPEEFQAVLDERSDVREAFAALTPGRQRAYLLFFEAPKQSKTRVSRIEKCLPQILAGKGMNE
jgi:uncharacterized protein YdeI (YjbR/CyaY-like superfamily)